MNSLKVRGITFGEGVPKICVPVTCKRPEELPDVVKKIRKVSPDAVELRADYFRDVFTGALPGGERAAEKESIQDFLKEFREMFGETVILFTWRTAGEGGRNPEEDALYGGITEAAIRSGAVDLVDIEYRHPERPVLVRAAKESGIPVIFSVHDFQKTPEEEEILRSFREMEQDGADIAKAAFMSFSREDTERLMRAARRAAGSGKVPIIAISMGEYGKKSRIRAEETGSCLTFGEAGESSAPGQIPVNELRKLLLAFHKEFV